MEIGHEYTEDERKRITPALPKGVTLSHPVCGSLLKPAGLGAIETFVRDDRAAGKEPYLAVTVAAGFDAEPIIGVPAPGLLAEKFPQLRKIDGRRLFNNGGILSPPQCPFNINQELFAAWLRGEADDIEAFLLRTATRWSNGDRTAAEALLGAWKLGDEAIRAWPKLNWYTAGPGQTQARWITRPLVPDITRLTPHERSAWERALFTLPWDPARVNVVFEGGIRFFEEESFERAVVAFDAVMLPKLLECVEKLSAAFTKTHAAVLADQRNRYRGLLLRSRTDRNLFEAQVAINNWLLRKGDRDQERARLAAAIRADLQNTRDWVAALRDDPSTWFHLASKEETPFLHKTPVEDLQLKLAAMEAHIADDPGPQLQELAVPKRKLQFSAVQ